MSARTIVVIGGGVAGLTAGGMLAKHGHRVRLFEANPKLGGCCGSTALGGYTFNDGAVFLLMRSVLDRVFEQLGQPRAELLPLRKVTANSTTWLPDGSVVTHGEGLALKVEGGPLPFDEGRTRAELEGLVEAWTPLYRTLTEVLMFEPPSALRMLARTFRHLPKMARTTAAELRRTVSHPSVRAALAGQVLYSGVPAEEAPSLGLLGLVALALEGAYLPEGGMGRIPQALSQALLRHGGEVRCGAPVERVLVEGGRVRGVEVAGLGRVEADAVVSTVSGMVTFGRLLEPGVVPPALARRLRSLALSHRAVSVQLGLQGKLRAPSFNLGVLPPMEQQRKYFDASGEMQWLAWSVPSAVDPTVAPEGGSVVEVFPPIDQGLPLSEWTEGRKAEVLEKTLRALSARHGKLQVAVQRVRGPREFQRELNLHEGALYGLSPATSPLSLFPRRTEVQGLYLAGQTTFPGYSVPAVAVSGLQAAAAVQEDVGRRRAA